MFKIGIEGIAKSVGAVRILTIEQGFLLLFLASFEAGILCSLMTIVNPLCLEGVMKGTEKETILG